jgi:hypothetical protein
LIVSPKEQIAKPGTTFDVTANFTLRDNERISDVRLSISAPAGWQVSAPANRDRYAHLDPGQTIVNRWTARLSESRIPGSNEIVVSVTYQIEGSSKGARTIVVADAIKVFVLPEAPTSDVYASDMPWLEATSGWGQVERDMSTGELDPGDGLPITINGVTYAKGIGTHAVSNVKLYTGKNCTTFSSIVGVDDEVEDGGSVSFEVYGDGRLLAATDVLRGIDPGASLNVNISGVEILDLRVTDGGDDPGFDHADWANARLDCGS